MPYLVCIVPVSPVRLQPSHKSEQVSQLLFGDVAEIVESDKDFTRIKSLYDDYEGWCQRSQLEEINYEQFEGKHEMLAPSFINDVEVNGCLMNIPMGCSIGHLQDKQVWGNYKIQYKGASWDTAKNRSPAETISTIARQFLNVAYQWGGRSVFGVDCSGFTQTVYRFAGIPLLRDAYQQASQGKPIGFLEEVLCGDLAFFDDDEQRITHVGILLNSTTIIHASGKVRIDTIDHNGIIHAEQGIRTHKLRIIKRVITKP